MSDNNQKPNAWGQNKNIPDSWGKNNKLPENWGKQSSNADSGTPSVRTKATSSSSVKNTANLSDKAKSGIGLLAGAAKKVGGAAKNAAGNAVEYAKSDETKERLNVAKNKARSLADGAGSKLTDIKEKTSDKINEHRQSRAEADVSEENITEDTAVVDAYEDVASENVEYADDFSDSDESEDVPKYEENSDDNKETNEHDRTIDDMIYAALSVEDKLQDSDDFQDAIEEKTVEDAAYESALTQTEYKRRTHDSENAEYTRPKYADDYTPPKYEDDEIVIVEPYEKKNNAAKILGCSIVVFIAAVIIINSLPYNFHHDEPKERPMSISSDINNDASDIQNTEANSDNLRKAALSALTEMSAEGYNLSGTYILSSSADYNTELPSGNFSADEFYKKVNTYFDKSNSYQWFVLIKGEDVINVAIGNSWNEKVIDSWNNDDGSFIPDETLQNLYNKTKDSIQVPVSEEMTSIADQYTSDEVSAILSSYISENPDPNHTYEGSDYGYALIDLNNDGAQELVITSNYTEEGSPDIVSIFAITNYKLESIWLSDVRTHNFLCEDNVIQASYIYSTGFGTIFYAYSSNNKLETIDSVSYDGTDYIKTGKNKITNKNNVEITEAEADAILAQYKKLKFETKPLEIAASSEPKTEPTTTKPEMKETYAFYGVVSIESGTLNLRDKPSTNSNVITQLEKDTKGSIYYIDGYSDWYKMYTDDGQSGYVSAQYIKEYTDSSNNSNQYVSGTQTPWGTFTYSNYRESQYSSYYTYDPSSIGITVDCNFDDFNKKHPDYRLDNVAFWTMKFSTETAPHNYDMGITVMGTVTSENTRRFKIKARLIDNSTGEQIGGNISVDITANLYSGETFCIDFVSDNMWETFRDIWDNSSYTLVLE